MIPGLIRLGVGVAIVGWGWVLGDRPSEPYFLAPWIVREGPSVGSAEEFRTVMGTGEGR